MSAPGKILFLMHAHLPYVHHPEYDRFFEENWLFEAMAETYLPLVQAMRRLLEKGVPGTLNLSVSAPLIEMLSNERLIDKFSEHLNKQLELIQKEVRLNEGKPQESLSKFYLERQKTLIDTWERRINRNLLGEFLELENAGKLNLLTCVGTHPFLPAYQSDPESIRLQLDVSVRCFERAFGRKPQGVWLPECGYFPGLDKYLAEYGIRYFFLETHGALLASPPPKYGVFTPLKTTQGLYCMGREQKSSMEVWSRRTGYPGHPEYREFFKDIAQERPKDYLGDYFFAGETPIDSGFKYNRITGSENKELYRPWNAMCLARDHAHLFVVNRETTISELLVNMEGNKACMLCPYDAELFGHWWFEGPLFLEAMLERAASSNVIEFAGADQVMTSSADPEVHEPAFSSWGEGGFGSVWINGETDQYYPQSYRLRAMIQHLKSIQERMGALGKKNGKLMNRYIKQMERELMLFQSSDWAFMIHNHSAEGYARRRLDEHYNNGHALFAEACKAVLKNSDKLAPSSILPKLEKDDCIFSWL
ncbi:glycoside hydrolase family 57 protein [Fibrobacter sp. HC4]|uniref:glycoside hydrolase family 57 protein n=1 Tax=Fibrobacter sp. HC4 TaxID=3239812 RepID=UPI002019E75F|nr:1,4-alpha-glucan branching protein domain-containing protein [Fibrobacter succinogenes]MCL4100962.1 1,4-alpha-glucan branching enzyme [Fibrobacter succinogenes]